MVGTSEGARLSALLQPIRELQQEQKKLLGMCTAVVESQKKVSSAVEELKTMIAEQTKRNFSTKGTSFEVKHTWEFSSSNVITNVTLFSYH